MASRPVVLVTGAARRLGRTIALDLARHGWRVALHYRQSAADAEATLAELRAAAGPDEAHAFPADLADEAECRALVPSVIERFGRIDAVVNSASLFEYDSAQTFGHAAMERHWRANTAPAILLAQALHADLTARGATGGMVNLLDQKLWNPNPDYFSYSLSKAALETATRLLAMALAPALRVAGVAPGITLVSGPMSDTNFAQAHALTPLGHSSTPEDIAHAVRFVLESPAITGTTLLVDGGQHLQAQARDVMFLAQNNKD